MAYNYAIESPLCPMSQLVRQVRAISVRFIFYRPAVPVLYVDRTRCTSRTREYYSFTIQL